MIIFDPVQVRSEDTSFLVERIPVGEIHEVTPMEKMLRRVSREFSRRKLIGDITISDEEFDLLIEHMRNVSNTTERCQGRTQNTGRIQNISEFYWGIDAIKR